MQYRVILMATFLGCALGIPNVHKYAYYPNTTSSYLSTTATYSTPWIGPTGSPCTTNCTTSVCGNGFVDPGEQCDHGPNNGLQGDSCSSNCTWVTSTCGDGIIEYPEQCDDGSANGTPASNCDAWCHNQPTNTTSTSACATCNPNPLYNLCTITTSCITAPLGNDYCACRAGYRADGLDPSDPRQFRLQFVGQEYRVFVAPGVDCNTLCDMPFPGPDSCREVPVQDTC